MRDSQHLQRSTRLRLHTIPEHTTLQVTQKALFALVKKIQRHIPTSPYVEVEQLVAKYT